MSAARSRQVISRYAPSSICASPAPRRSRTVVNRPTGNMLWRAKRATSAGPMSGSWSSTRISASGSGSAARSGFARLTSEVALARVGLVLGLEVSRLARNNAEWYRLIDMDTAQFAVNAIRRWREIMGRERYPESGRLMIAADGGELHRQAPPSRGSRLKHLFCGVALSSKSAPSRRKHAA